VGTLTKGPTLSIPAMTEWTHNRPIARLTTKIRHPLGFRIFRIPSLPKYDSLFYYLLLIVTIPSKLRNASSGGVLHWKKMFLNFGGETGKMGLTQRCKTGEEFLGCKKMGL